MSSPFKRFFFKKYIFRSLNAKFHKLSKNIRMFIFFLIKNFPPKGKFFLKSLLSFSSFFFSFSDVKKWWFRENESKSKSLVPNKKTRAEVVFVLTPSSAIDKTGFLVSLIFWLTWVSDPQQINNYLTSTQKVSSA